MTQQLTSRVIEYNAGEVVDSELRVDVRLGFKVVHILAMVVVQLRQQRGVSRLRKFGLLVDESEYIHWLHGDHVQRLLVVNELNAAPVNCLVVVLLL